MPIENGYHGPLEYDGMDRADVDDAVAILRRAPVLAACRDGPVDRSTITERTAYSRATAYRATDALTDRGLLEREPTGYRLTGLGRAVLAQVDEFDAGLTGARRLGPVLAYADAPELAANANLFTDARVVTADRAEPYRIDRELEAVVADTDRRMVGVTTAGGPPSVIERTYEAVRAGVETEWVFTREALASMVAQHEGHEELLVLDTTATFVAEGLPFDLAVYDDTLVVPGYDDERGVAAAVVLTDDPAAVAWGHAVFERCRDRAERLD